MRIQCTQSVAYQFCRYRDIILGIHEDDIPSYNASRRTLLEKLKIKSEREKEEAQKSTKLAGDLGNQGVCCGELVNKPPIHARRAQEGMLWTIFYVLHTYYAHI